MYGIIGDEHFCGSVDFAAGTFTQRTVLAFVQTDNDAVMDGSAGEAAAAGQPSDA